MGEGNLEELSTGGSLRGKVSAEKYFREGPHLEAETLLINQSKSPKSSLIRRGGKPVKSLWGGG